MASLRSCFILAAGLPLAIAGGCAGTHDTDSSWISPGALYGPQDENYEIKGKPQSGGGAQAGFGGPGGEVNPQSLEADAIAPQIHYHHHVHFRYHHFLSTGAALQQHEFLIFYKIQKSS